jgi:hypothetical protein
MVIACTFLLDSGGFGSNVVRAGQCLVTAIEKEELQGGTGDNKEVRRPRHIHDPGIQQGPFEITTTLACEINTLAYPKAALCTFCLALLAYNAVSLLKAALRSHHGRQKVTDEVSGSSLALEISRTYDGMMIAIPAPHWALFRALSPQAFASALQELAASVDVAKYRKHPRGPKKKPPERAPYQNGQHVATAKLLAQR